MEYMASYNRAEIDHQEIVIARNSHLGACRGQRACIGIATVDKNRHGMIAICRLAQTTTSDCDWGRRNDDVRCECYFRLSQDVIRHTAHSEAVRLCWYLLLVKGLRKSM